MTLFSCSRTPEEPLSAAEHLSPFPPPRTVNSTLHRCNGRLCGRQSVVRPAGGCGAKGAGRAAHRKSTAPATTDRASATHQTHDT